MISRQLAHGMERSSGRSAATIPIPVLPGLRGRPLTAPTEIVPGRLRRRDSKSKTKCCARLPSSAPYCGDRFNSTMTRCAVWNSRSARSRTPTAFEQQPRTHEQRQRECHLRGDQRCPQAPLARRSGDTTLAFA